jgi:hypothetical protein
MLAGVGVSHAWEPRILWTFEILAAFTTNAAGSAIVNAIGPTRQIVQGGADAPRRYLVIAPAAAGKRCRFRLASYFPRKTYASSPLTNGRRHAMSLAFLRRMS